MHKLRLIFVTIILLIVLFVVGFVAAGHFFSAGINSETSPLIARTVNSLPEILSGQTTVTHLRDFANSPQECNLSFATGSNFVEGTAFVADKQLRVDVLLENGRLINLVVLDTYNDFIIIPDLPTDEETVDNLLKTVVSYICQPWQIDNSVFALTRP